MKHIFFIDTNVFLRFLIPDKTNPILSKQAKEIFSQISSDKIKVIANHLIISEVVYTLESYYKLTKNEISEKLTILFSNDNILIRKKGLILKSLLVFSEKNVDFEDAYTYLKMKENGIENIFTFDQKHFRRFDDINIVS